MNCGAFWALWACCMDVSNSHMFAAVLGILSVGNKQTVSLNYIWYISIRALGYWGTCGGVRIYFCAFLSAAFFLDHSGLSVPVTFTLYSHILALM